MHRLIFLLMVSALCSSCASIISDNAYPVAINSAPDAAAFTIADGHGEVIHTGITPATVMLRSGGGYFSAAYYEINFNKEGFAERTSVLRSSMDGWYFGNIAFGGPIGMLLVDPLSGAMWRLPLSHKVTLNRSGRESEPQRKH